jgi:hypothetical protein
MENEYINGEVMETEEESAKGTGKGWKIAGGSALAVLVGALAYKFVVKPIAKKVKAKKEQKRLESGEHADGNAAMDEAE